MKKPIILTFWILIGTFLFIVSQFFIQAVRELFRGSLFFLLPFIIFSLLGGLLIFFTVKEKVEGALRKFLILVGASAVGFFVSVLLHNFFYALGVITSNITILRYLTEILHVTFFLIAIFVCPLGFLIGAIGSIIIFVRGKDYRSRTN
jgi:uncharacterized membrane protein